MKYELIEIRPDIDGVGFIINVSGTSGQSFNFENSDDLQIWLTTVLNAELET